VHGNPIRYFDPSGKRICEDPFNSNNCNSFPVPPPTPLPTPPTPIPPSTQCETCSVHPVVDWIIDRIRMDSTSETIQSVYALNNTHYYDDAFEAYQQMSLWKRLLLPNDYFISAMEMDNMSYIASLSEFGCAVSDQRLRPACGKWDYKKEIEDDYDNSRCINFCSIGHDEEVIFYYDIWANIHFGYLGRVGGFTESTLLIGADLEQMISNIGEIRDDPSDKIAIT